MYVCGDVWSPRVRRRPSKVVGSVAQAALCRSHVRGARVTSDRYISHSVDLSCVHRTLHDGIKHWWLDPGTDTLGIEPRGLMFQNPDEPAVMLQCIPGEGRSGTTPATLGIAPRGLVNRPECGFTIGTTVRATRHYNGSTRQSWRSRSGSRR